ncbi:uncharacterized protein BJ171DRAFT_473837 [Polychytrium aggregatum]|uniref:uncharacterized protein n=1 Tax=Polychytrium aggregatum TaxID=110093 RepID=UPI0022FDB3B3|nr:uncharacterized protein BJ171DRAFT_473837 [Polychytrium aggregatum]KAI9205810.1 hypothetical protein BJ171DRAFT_473837 [Polychytrium aggregatum]
MGGPPPPPPPPMMGGPPPPPPPPMMGGPPPPPPPPPMMGGPPPPPPPPMMGGPPPPPPPPPIMGGPPPPPPPPMMGGPPPPPPPPPMMGGPPPPPPPPMMGGPPPPPPPPPIMGGPPPPPPPPMMGGPPPPPPPPPIMGGPPPPPPPPMMGFVPPPPAAAAPPKSSGDPMEEIRRAIQGGVKLRKVNREIRPQPEVKKEVSDDEATKMALVFDILNLVETTDGGSPEEIVSKLELESSRARTYIFQLIRRGWVKPYRLLDGTEKESEKDRKLPYKVWQGKEVTSAIEVPGKHEFELEELGLLKNEIIRAHLHRFAKNSNIHTVDTIVLLRCPGTPTEIPPFDKVEPPKLDSSFKGTVTKELRQQREDWERQRDEYFQAPWPTFRLFMSKIEDHDRNITSDYQKYSKGQEDAGRVIGELTQMFKELDIPQLTKLVSDVPKKINEVAENLSRTSGIQIPTSSVKVSTVFVRRMVDETLGKRPKAEGAPEVKSRVRKVTFVTPEEEEEPEKLKLQGASRHVLNSIYNASGRHQMPMRREPAGTPSKPSKPVGRTFTIM